MRRILLLLVAGVAILAGVAYAAVDATVQATLETEQFFDERDEDADDPAIWVHRANSRKSIVVGTLKNGGLAVFDLDAKTIQRIDYEDEDARQNNVDVMYDVRLGGVKRDLMVVTDRGLDHLRVFAVDPRGSEASAPLTEVTEADPPVVFEGDDDISAYGVAAWKAFDGTPYVVVSQRHQTKLKLLRLVPRAAGTVGWELVDTLALPSTFEVAGQPWTPCVEEDGEAPQVEGMVVDDHRGLLFAGQEDVGFWRIRVIGGRFGEPRLFDRVREFGQAYERVFDAEEEEYACEIDESSPSYGSPYLAADAEGVTIYRTGKLDGYLIGSSQGSSEFVVYDLLTLRKIRTFAIGDGPAIDGVQESDGAMVASVPLGQTFRKGLLVTHDGDDEPGDDVTNFKFTRWQDVARALNLEIDTSSGDPRR